MKIAFTNATIYPVEGNNIENGVLLIDGKKIVDLGGDLDTSGYDIVDCFGKHITPGFIDPHSHVGLSEEGAGPGPANSDTNELVDPVVPFLRSRDAIFPADLGFEDARSGGVTVMGITHGSGNAIGGQICAIKSYGHVVDDMIIKDPVGIKMAMGENPKRVGVNNKRSPQTRMGVAYTVRKAFYSAIDYRNKWLEYASKVKNEKNKPKEEQEYVKPPERDLGNDVLIKMMDGKIKARCHSHRSDDIRTAIRLAEEFGLNLVIDHATEAFKIKEIIKEKGIPVVVGPVFTARRKRELLQRTLKTAGILMKEGIQVSITTDAPVIPIQGLRDSVIQSIREGLTEDRALETITINSAKILDLDDRIGSLKAGKDADFLIFNGDPLDARNKVINTYIDGKLVFETE